MQESCFEGASLDEVSDEANMGLSCGNPVAMAALRPELMAKAGRTMLRYRVLYCTNLSSKSQNAANRLPPGREACSEVRFARRYAKHIRFSFP